MSPITQSRFTVQVPLEYVKPRNLALYHTLTGAFIIIHAREWETVRSRPNWAQSRDAVSLLLKESIMVTPDTDETLLFETWRQQHIQNFSTLKSKVLVTRRCNNRCIYCILNPEAKDMSRETAHDIDQFYTDLILERKPDQVTDDYLGGEPLINRQIIMDSAQRRYYFCRGKGIDYSFIITTNGTLLTRDVISSFKKIGLAGIRVSLAGPKDVHDKLRPSRKNEPTYARIISNLQRVTKIIPISIEYQYDSGATDFLGFPDMLDDLSSHDVNIENVAITPIMPRRHHNKMRIEGKDAKIEIFLKREAARRGFPVYDEPPSNACMAEQKSTFVFDTDGSILPCPSLQSREMAYGHVAKGVDFVAESQLIFRQLPEHCLTQCEILPICQGGCRLQALVKNGEFKGIDCHYSLQLALLEDWMRQKAAAALSK